MISTFGTYGITDQWDVNVLVPIVVTSLDVEARAVISGTSGVHLFEDGGIVERAQAEDEKVGVGDILLRTKYRFTDNLGFNVGSVWWCGYQPATRTTFRASATRRSRRSSSQRSPSAPTTASERRGRDRPGGLVEAVPVTRRVHRCRSSTVSLSWSTSSELRATDEEVTVSVATFDELGNEVGSQRQTTEFRTDIFDISAGFKLIPIGT